MMDYKLMLRITNTASRDPNVSPAVRRRLLMMRSVVQAAPFWRRRRVWDRLWDFITIMALEEEKNDLAGNES